MTTYKGKKITGTSGTAKVFKDVEFKDWFYVGDLYLNESTGHVYYCAREGWRNGGKIKDERTGKWVDSDPATWRYDHTKLVKKPSGKVTSLSTPKRTSTYVYQSSWKVPSDLTSDKNGGKANKLLRTMKITYLDAKNKEHDIKFKKKVAITTTSDTLNLNSSNVYVDKGGPTGRRAFWPYTSYKVKSIAFGIRALNKFGEGPSASEALDLKVPDKPKITSLEVDVERGVVVCKIKPAKDEGGTERLQTRYELGYKDIGAEGNGQYKWQKSTNTTDDEFTVETGDLVNWMNTNHHYVVAARARSEGLRGDSGWTSFVYCGTGWPDKPTVGNVVISEAARKDDTKYGYLGITSTNATLEYPVDQVVLQVLRNQPTDHTAERATDEELAAASNSEDWEDLVAEDNDKCTALGFRVGEVRPLAGTRTYLRIKSWNDIEGLFARFSDPKDVWMLFSAGAMDNKCTILGIKATEDDTSLDVIVAWDSASSATDDDTTSVELSWSDDSDAWRSTKSPNSHEFKWHDDPKAAGATGWNKTATVKVKELDPGTTYYFQARCIVEDGESRTEGPWCAQMSSSPSLALGGAALDAPSSAAKGSDIPLSWSYSGPAQTRWTAFDSAGASVANGDGPVQSGAVSAANAWSHAINGVLALFVHIETPGGSIDTNTKEIRISEPPVISIGSMGTVTAQPVGIPLECSIAGSDVAIVVSANGCSMEFPEGTRRQTAGDTVWSGVVSPTWEGNGPYTATVTLDAEQELYDGATYTVTAVATDAVTKLQSETAVAEFTVAWARQAPAIPDFEVVAGVSEEDGLVTRYAEIQLAPPQNAESTDVYDVYRVTGDGARLIASDCPQDILVTDRYAPFGPATHFYRVAVRTIDGDIAWRDFDYQLDGPGLRFDFEGDSHDYVELSWNIKQQDSYAKDFLLSKGMDGTKAGAWNPAVERKGSYQTDIIKVKEQDKSDAVRDLARYAGAVFVRTSAGLAFAANVDVDSMDVELGSPAIAVSFGATEIDPDDRFMADVPVEDETEAGD